MRPLTRLLGELDPPVRLGSGVDLPRQNNAKLLLPGYAVLLSTSPSCISTESIGEDKDKDVIGLIRPVKDLSIWLAEDQVGFLEKRSAHFPCRWNCSLAFDT